MIFWVIFFYDIKTGYGSIKNLFNQAKEEKPSITYDEVREWYNKQKIKQTKNYKGYNSYTAPFPRYEYQIDFMDMNNLQKSLNQPRYALVVIDIFSKYGQALAMDNKDNESVLKSIQIQ